MSCLDEGALLRVCSGDATDAERRHATTCATCTHALAMLQADLGRLGAVIGDGVPVRPTARRRGMRLVPIAAAAALMLAVVLARRTPAPVADGDELAMLDDLGTAVATYDVGGLSDDGDTDDGATARSTCTWGEPLFQTGCDDDAPATLIAWR
jgi:hypothetical protein